VVLLYALERHLYKNADMICTALPFVSDYMRRKKIRRQGIFWIPNAVDLRSLRTESSNGNSDICLSMQSQHKLGKLNVVYVGGLGPANRVDCILEAAKILQEKGENGLHFSIVGEGHARNQLSEYISSNNLDAVKLWPAVPAHAVSSILQRADIGVLCLHDNPIYKYGINLHKLYDYMAAGLPIVFSANVRNNLVESAHAGITVPPGDAGAIASALLKLKSSTVKQRSEMGMNGNRHISENYALEVLSKKYFDIITNQNGVVSDDSGI
jgi:glycosyltransferase involved in cell wall biosynthesis